MSTSVQKTHVRSAKSKILLLLFTFFAAPVLLAQDNGVMMQYFHWYYPEDGSLWTKVQNEASDLAAKGVTALWLPPAYKAASGGVDVGYGVYDMYDLGEFNQKGSIRTKYGTKDQYLAAISAAQSHGIQIYGDVVFNHRGGADDTEPVTAVRVQSWNRNYENGSDTTIEAWTVFDFPGRGNQYSSFKLRWYHFDGVDWDQATGDNSIFKFRGAGKGWDWEVDTENGNYDYLMFADLDFDHPEVVQELTDWGIWYTNFTNVDGFRIDAIKHIQYDFFDGWLSDLRAATGKELFTVGEFWSYDIGKLHNYITKSNGAMALFDAPLHLNFYNASRSGGSYDMRYIKSGTLMEQQPALAVTLVENHDTQPLQALESPVMDWFKPLAYAFILLRQEGYPNLFYADYYGANYTDKGYSVSMASHKDIIDKLLYLRKTYNYGPQYDYLDHQDVIGWTRLGNAENPGSMAVLINDGPAGSKWMETGKSNKTYVDYTGNHSGSVTTNSSGWGNFPVNGGSVSVWIEQGSTGGGNNVSVDCGCENGTTYWGQNVYIVGSIPELGSWNAANAIQLDPTNYPTWRKTLQLPASTTIEWKCIKKDGNGNVQWQGGANNSYTTPASGTGSTTGSF